jgi:SAM-dependent methyltransferase
MSDNAYDAVRYSNNPYAQTHPERLATVAILHGLTPPDPFAARVLEIGCGAGGNLMAMASATPGIRALGVDLAAEPIAEGQAAIAEIGLGNIELRQGDLRDLADGSLGEFDYIVAHGVYSWIPADARDALMATIRASLAPAGVAYVSFNAHPGGYFRRMLRDVGLWHARAHDDNDPAERAAKAQELYKFLAKHRMTSADTYGALLEREVPALADGPIYRLVHDDLSDHWHPVWFADFAAHAGRHELAYLGEADLYGLRGENLPDGVEPELWQLAGGDRVAFENYTDLLTARHFRQSLVCHAGQSIAIEPAAELTERLHWAVRLHAEPLEVGLVADIFAELDARRPRTLSFIELQERLGIGPAPLGEALLDGFRRERLIPHAGPLRVALEPGERPKVSALARWQAAHGPAITSLAYTSVRMEEPAARLLITLLDGTRDRAAIRAELHARSGLELSETDLDNNLVELGRLFLLEP